MSMSRLLKTRGREFNDPVNRFNGCKTANAERCRITKLKEN